MANCLNFYDLLPDILSRLPVKSLVRFNSVSKQWQSLISDAGFRYRLSPDILGLALYSKFKLDLEFEYEQVFISDNAINVSLLNHPYGSRLIRILQACNGLMLMELDSDLNNKDKDYCVYNPSTRQSVTLPPFPKGDVGLPPLRKGVVGLRLSLAFDPTNSPHYKVVYVYVPYAVPYSNCELWIYSSQTRSWRETGRWDGHNLRPDFKDGVLCNGIIHWLNCWGGFSIYFNVEEEKLGNVRMPSTTRCSSDRTVRYLGESRGHLHLVQMHYTAQKLYVFEMESDCSRWFVKYQVDFQSLMVVFPEVVIFHSQVCVVGVAREANDEDSYMVLYAQTKVIRFNFKDGSFRRIGDWFIEDGRLRTVGPWFQNKRLEYRTSMRCQFIQTVFPV